jgi:proprotein convertase subtilisin/kexin type 2
MRFIRTHAPNFQKLAGALAVLCLLACTPKKDPRHGRLVATVPLAPSALTITNNDGYASVSWAPQLYATHYKVSYGTAPGAYTVTIDNAQPPVTFGGLVNGQTYYVAVRSVGDLGSSTSLSPEGTLLPVNGTGTADTLFARQWHLDNTGQLGADSVAATVGEDVNLPADCHPAATCRGEGVRVVVVDDGLEIAHDDLKANVFPGLSYNFLDASDDPTESASDVGHGTMVAGIIAARDLNDMGVRGVAPRANILGYNFLQSSSTTNLATSVTRNIASIAVSNNSWGPRYSGLGCYLDTGGATFTAALSTGLSTGRGGLGTIYVFSAGNGHTGYEAGASDAALDCPLCEGNANLNRVANHFGVITAGAVNAHGAKSTYSETGANLLVSAPGGEFCSYTSGGSTTVGSLAITTTDNMTSGLNVAGTGYTDLANRKYTQCMNGTSSAAPNTSGVVALMLQANPALGWRDVRYILATTARKNDAADAGWANNDAGFHFNNKYGFGVVDASAAVAAAAAYGANIVPVTPYNTTTLTVNTAIPDNNTTGISTNAVVAASGITSIDYIEVSLDISDHDAPGDLEITLRNTTTGGIISTLVPAHAALNSACPNYNNIILGTNAHLGEAADGTWTLTVKDLDATTTGTLDTWGMTIYGH